MNAPYLESSEQLDRFFPDFLHKIKFYIFQNISKCSVHILRPFKYNNTCQLCKNILEKYKRGRIMANNVFVLREEVINVFHDKIYIPTIENCYFILLMSGFLVQWNFGRLQIIVSMIMHKNIYIKLKK